MNQAQIEARRKGGLSTVENHGRQYMEEGYLRDNGQGDKSWPSLTGN